MPVTTGKGFVLLTLLHNFLNAETSDNPWLGSRFSSSVVVWNFINFSQNLVHCFWNKSYLPLEIGKTTEQDADKVYLAFA